MKKHLIAAAVAAAVAAPAMAQNVSISGVLDVGYGQFKNRTGAQGSGKESYTSAITNVFSTTGISFRGTEDLGGGLKAGFNITQEFSPASGAYTDSDYQYACGDNVGRADCQGSNFQDANVFVSGAFGSVKLGKLTFSARDAGGVGRFGGNFGRLSGSFRSLGDKTNGGIEYTTPSFNGFSVSLAQADDTSTSEYATGKQRGVFARYDAGKLAVAVGQIKVTDGQQSAGVALTTGMKNMVVGAQYDFGAFRLGGIYATYKDDANQNEKRRGMIVNLLMPLGDGYSLHGSYHDYKEDQNAQDAKSRLFFAGVMKDLSKRTQLYAVAGQNKTTDNGAAAGMAASIVGATANETNRTYALGVRHSF